MNRKTLKNYVDQAVTSEKLSKAMEMDPALEAIAGHFPAWRRVLMARCLALWVSQLRRSARALTRNPNLLPRQVVLNPKLEPRSCNLN
jgi:hypothetical protein